MRAGASAVTIGSPASIDPAAFHVLALAEVDAVHRLASHLCRDRHEADDLVQETYLRALRPAGTFSPGEHGVRRWLFKILHNVLHTRRSRDRRRRDVLRNFGDESRATTEEAGPPPVAGVDWADTWAVTRDGLDERLCRAIRLLPVAHRTVFYGSGLRRARCVDRATGFSR